MLPLTAADVDRTRLPLTEATQLPGAAFTDPAVLDWELDHLIARYRTAELRRQARREYAVR